MNKKIKCRICQNKAKIWNTKNGFNIYRCTGCNSGFIYPYLSLDEIKNIYETSENKDTKKITLNDLLINEKNYPNSTVDSKRIINKINDLGENKKEKAFLDIGGGYGFFTKEALEKDFKVEALEIGEIEKNIFFEYTKIMPIYSTFEEFNTDKRYDAILMSHILEHSIDPVAWIQKTNLLLNNGGVLAIAVPNFNSITKHLMGVKEMYITPPDHLNYLTIKSLKILLENNGFKIQYCHTLSRTNYKRICEKLNLPQTIAPLLKFIGNSFLNISNLLNLGIFINCYAIKIRDLKEDNE